MTPGGLVAVVLAAGLMVFGGSTRSALTPQQVVAARAAANKKAAEQDTARTLQLVRLPPGARRASDLPSRIADLLGHLSEGDPARTISRHSDWLVRGSPEAALGWLAHHQIKDWRSENNRTTYGSPEGSATATNFEWRSSVAGVWEKGLQFIVTQMPHGGTAIRAEAKDIWLLPRSPAEQVPSTAHVMTVSVKGQGAQRSISTTKSGLIAAVTRLINRQRVVQFDEFASCGPAIPDEGRRIISLSFRRRSNSQPIADVSQTLPASICDDLIVAIKGKSFPSLYGGPLVVHRVRGLLRQIKGRS